MFVQISDAIKIKEITVDQLGAAFPVVSQLRKHLNLGEFIDIVKAMKPGGYRMVCLYENEEIVSYAGFAKLVNLYYGEHIWVYDLITDENKRGTGYGKLLLLAIEKYACDSGLSCIALSTRVQNEKAQKFYEITMDFDKISYVYKKELTHV